MYWAFYSVIKTTHGDCGGRGGGGGEVTYLRKSGKVGDIVRILYQVTLCKHDFIHTRYVDQKLYNGILSLDTVYAAKLKIQCMHISSNYLG